MTTNFSIIIPHKNSPQLLQRCLRSIPQRDDLEIVIIDDNSDVNKKPQIERQDVSVIYLGVDQAAGPGHARNVGLDRAKGMWVLFADADDSFTDSLNSSLDLVLTLDVDVVYCSFNIIKDDRAISRTINTYKQPISKEESFKLKYGITAAWNKIVRASFIERYRIRFEECLIGEDLLFSNQIAFFSQKRFTMIYEPLYNYFFTPSSITHMKNNNESYYLSICKHLYQQNALLRYIGESKHVRSLFSKSMAIIVKKSWKDFIIFLKVFYSNRKEIIEGKNYFVDVIKSHQSSK